jgi:hypothetical protein
MTLVHNAYQGWLPVASEESTAEEWHVRREPRRGDVAVRDCLARGTATTPVRFSRRCPLHLRQGKEAGRVP